jgi:uncharacterized membrane protein YraQ (UPF0718 family)/copper chaperone CopZ
MEYVVSFLSELWVIVVAMSPYLLLGFLFAGILKVWFPQRWIDRYMGKSNFVSVFNTALLGVPLPLCSCGVIPTGISFYRNGASKGASVAFLISTPQTGVDSVLVTYSLLGLPFALIRVVVALITGVAGGLFTNWFDKTQSHVDVLEKGKKEYAHRLAPIFRVFQYGFYEFLMDIAKWLIVGLLIAAAMAVVIPDNFFTLYIDNEFLSMLMVLVASVPLYICATASVPIAAVLMLKGLSPGAALVLLMAGPATNAATITVIKKVFGNRTLFSYLASIVLGAMLFGLAINHFMPREWFAMAPHALHHGHGHDHELLPYWFQWASAIVMIALIVNGYAVRYIKNHQKVTVPPIIPVQPATVLAKPATTAHFVGNLSFAGMKPTHDMVVKVQGMTCNHCKASVESNLSQIAGVDAVSANVQSGRVTLSGSAIDLDQVQKVVDSLGYQFLGKV